MSSIDDLLKVSTLNNNISNNNQLDQFWETSNNIGSNTWSNGPIATRNNFNF
jgi:hypothetical protein